MLRPSSSSLVTLLLILVAIFCATASAQDNDNELLSNGTASKIWAIKLSDLHYQGDSSMIPDEKIEQIAMDYGLKVLGRVGNLKEYFLVAHDPAHPKTRHARLVHSSLEEHPDIAWVEFQQPRIRDKRAIPTITDPLYASQWHIKNNAAGGWDLNIHPAWSEGFTGRGVGISIVDDGLDWRHGDFSSSRYMAAASWNWNGNTNDPSPHRSDDTHGTACAGLAFAGINDGHCGAGIAYQAEFGAQRLISEPTTDAMEASALGFRPDLNHIYSSSWGPTDDGTRKEGMGTLLREAIKQSIKTGRQGKGNIYIWAGGNGGPRDNVNYDGYANSIYTIAIASADSNGRKAYYSEEGSCIIATSVSSPPGIVSTGVRNSCNTRFGGTSAAAPMIAGVVALMLDANPELGWRDVQDILIKTARKNDPTDSDWVNNAAGLHVNHKYGFGLVDAGAAVAMASDSNRQNLPPSLEPPKVYSYRALPAKDIPDNNRDGLTTSIEVSDTFVLEHVEVTLRVTHPRRGDLRIELTGPTGIKSVFAVSHGDRNANYSNWTFTSVRHWGESPKGTWKLTIADEAPTNHGQLNDWRITFHGH